MYSHTPVAHGIYRNSSQKSNFTWPVLYPRRRKRQPTPVFMPGKSHGPRSLVGYNPCGCKKSDTTERLLCVCVCVPPGGDCGSATGEASFWIRIMSGPAHPAGAWTTQEGKKCTLAHGIHSVCEKQSSHHLCFNIWPWRRESGWYNDETS